MIGYYIHHSGYGHIARARAITAHVRHPVTALTSAQIDPPHPFADVVTLPRDDSHPGPVNASAHGVLHWAPQHDPGLRRRMRAIAEWVDTAQPAAVIVDVSVEVAAFTRLMGVPTIVMAMPGQRTDPPHRWVYQLADHILAAWPRELYEPAWLREHRDKTTYVGGISRFDGRDRPARTDRRRIAVLGCGEPVAYASQWRACAAEHPSYDWLPIGAAGGPWVADPWPALAGAHVVIAQAGQSSVADLAAASVPAIIIPQPRPFGEQHSTATVLQQSGLAVVAPRWPADSMLPALVERAAALGGQHWMRWRTHGAAQRAASVIGEVAAGNRPPAVP